METLVTVITDFPKSFLWKHDSFSSKIKRFCCHHFKLNLHRVLRHRIMPSLHLINFIMSVIIYLHSLGHCQPSMYWLIGFDIMSHNALPCQTFVIPFFAAQPSTYYLWSRYLPLTKKTAGFCIGEIKKGVCRKHWLIDTTKHSLCVSICQSPILLRRIIYVYKY